MRPTVALVASEPFAQIDDAVLAELDDGLAGRGVDLLQVVADAEDEAAILAVLALPVVHAPPGDPFEALVNPDFLPGRSVQRHERTVAAFSVDHAARHDGIEHGLPVGVGPRDIELRDVRFVDLFEGAELGVVRPAAVVTPFAWILIAGRRHGRCGTRDQDANLADT